MIEVISGESISINDYGLSEEEIDEVLDYLYSKSYKNSLYNDDYKDS